MGLSVGAGLGASNGYPNDSKKIGRAKYYSESGSRPRHRLGDLARWGAHRLAQSRIGFGFSNLYAKARRAPRRWPSSTTDVYPLYR